MTTRSTAGIVKPKAFQASLEPRSVKQALNMPEWKVAMDLEYDAWMKNNTWELVKLPPNRSAIRSRWVFRAKYNSDGPFQKYKTRLVAQGYAQRPGFDFTETYSPVVKPTSIRIILSIALANSWLIRQLDVNNAFLYGDLMEEVYMKQPQGFEQGDSSLPTKSDVSVFQSDLNGTKTFVLVYVDDIIVTGESEDTIKQVIEQLNAKFALKDMGSLHYFLGIQVTNTSNGGLILTQQKYIKELMKKANMVGCTSCHTPLPSTVKLSACGSAKFHDSALYMSIIGSLQYLTVTRPEISYSVHKLAQFIQSPLKSHWKMIKRVLRYLNGTFNHGLHLKKEGSMTITAYSDSDWAEDPDDRKSTSGYCIFLGSNLVSWGSRKQTAVAKSSTETEYRSVADLVVELIWVKNLLFEL
ncbi:uncharacterized protein LOC107610775 [Arachis ipaensis]|uniref:uncharacterized protein LOC107610775 n=1 Tax=Arachis ipaensis TaxID=130454 RepID=UPI0007AF059D|nr:uncharacterized protein LOC107610775 [Arachis ipaensis]XP_025628520.1 uncharacterized protein LOC112721697 [Arachis hypogaea]